MTEIAVRIDAPVGGTPSVSMLAFRASATGVAASDVLGLVDPLVAPAPIECELRELVAATQALRTAGGTVELEPLADLTLQISPSGPLLAPLPRVYPQLGSVVSGIIGEAGPEDMNEAPAQVVLSMQDQTPRAQQRESIDIPALPRFVGTPTIESSGDWTVVVTGPPQTFVEIRPFGATLAVACPAGTNGRITVPRAQMETLLATSGSVPVYVEAVWRDSRLVGANAHAHLSLELRSSIVMDTRHFAKP